MESNPAEKKNFVMLPWVPRDSLLVREWLQEEGESRFKITLCFEICNKRNVDFGSFLSEFYESFKHQFS